MLSQDAMAWKFKNKNKLIRIIIFSLQKTAKLNSFIEQIIDYLNS